MTIPIRQSTASQQIPLGHFLDSTNGDSEENGLTIANTDIKLWKRGATTLANKNSGGATNISNGVYYCVLDATDSNTLGGMVIFVHVAGALAVRVECEVMTANRFDALVLGTDVLHADVTQWLGTAAATPAVAGVPEVDVTKWRGTTVLTPTGGRPKVDTDSLMGFTTGANYLNDLVTGGYDHVNHKIEACKVNDDMRGTDSAALATTALTNAMWTDAKAGALADWLNGGRLDLLLDATKAKTDNLPSGIAKNAAISAFSVFMVLASDSTTPATGKTVTCTISKDGAAFGASTNSVAEISNGMYKIALIASELNADVVTLRFTAAACNDRIITIHTS